MYVRTYIHDHQQCRAASVGYSSSWNGIHVRVVCACTCVCVDTHIGLNLEYMIFFFLPLLMGLQDQTRHEGCDGTQ